jgi:DUF1365 family protein
VRSALYPGLVRHRRRGEIDHELSSRVVMALFDLDELAELDRSVRGFGVDRAAPVSFRSRDHGHADGSDLRTWVAEVTATTGADVTGPVQVLCMPRVVGHAFDPISVWFCHDRAGRLSAIVHEVRNTFGGRHAYVVPDPLAGAGGSGAAEGGRVVDHRAEKAFHVSPFFDVDGDYRFRLRLPDDRIALAITHDAGDGHVLTASFTGRRTPFTTAGLWRQMLTHPLLPQRVLAQIHLEAAKLWRKGARYRPVPPPGPDVTVGDASSPTPGSRAAADLPQAPR